jgi:hypothetical protein
MDDSIEDLRETHTAIIARIEAEYEEKLKESKRVIYFYYVSPSNEGRHCFSLIFWSGSSTGSCESKTGDSSAMAGTILAISSFNLTISDS